MATQEEINLFREHLEKLKTPLGYQPVNIGQFGFFLERHGEALIDELDASIAYRMQAAYADDILHAALEEMERLKTEIQKLKTENGTLKAKR